MVTVGYRGLQMVNHLKPAKRLKPPETFSILSETAKRLKPPETFSILSETAKRLKPPETARSAPNLLKRPKGMKL